MLRLCARPRRPDFSLRLACYRPARCSSRPRRPIPATRVLFFGATDESPFAVPAVRVDRAALRHVVQWVGPGVPILACPRIGEVEHVLPDWITGDCCLFGCGKVLWVSTRVAWRCGGVGEVALVCAGHLMSIEEVL